MEPVIPAKSFILAVNWFMFFSVKEGQRLVIKHHKYGVIVKTVALVDKSGFIWSKGENYESLPVEQIGPVDKSQILGRVIHIFKPEPI